MHLLSSCTCVLETFIKELHEYSYIKLPQNILGTQHFSQDHVDEAA